MNITLFPPLRMSRLYGAKVFTKLDVQSGFWHGVLTRNHRTSQHFGGSVGKECLPQSAQPQTYSNDRSINLSRACIVWRSSQMTVVLGFGHTHLEATHDHDNNLMTFLQRCEAQGVVLNTDKLTLRQPKSGP